MHISPLQRHVTHRVQSGNANSKGTDKTASNKLASGGSSGNESSESASALQQLLEGKDQQQPSDGLVPFNNPMDDADTLMRAILANYVEHKVEKQISTPTASPGQSQSGEDKALAGITEQFQSRFKENASDPEAFHSLMKQSFGEGYDYSKAENIRQQTLNGDFSWMPEIKVVDGATLTDTSGQQGEGVGHGAYSKDTDTIYLSRELLTSDPSKAEEILTEEVGHALDARINVNDAAGDEGDIFSILSHGGEISEAELTELRSENDSGTIMVDGKEVEVEYGFFKKLFKKVTKPFKKVAQAVTSIASKATEIVKDHVSSVWDAAKSGFNKIMQSELLGQIMTVAQFVPIPVVQLVAKGYNLVKAGYTAYQGIKHGSMSMVLGGVAGAFGGAAKLGGALGATGAWVGKAANIGKMVGSASAAHQMISEKNFAGAAALIGNQLGADSKVTGVLNTVVKVENVRQAIEDDNLFGVVGAGSSLLQDFTGPETDQFLSTIDKHTGTIQQIDNARKTGDYGQALGLLRENFGDTLGIPAGAQSTIQRIENGISYAQTVDALIDNKDYTAAAGMLLNTTASNVTNPTTKANIEKLGNTITTVDNAVQAFDDGRYNDAVGFAADALGNPLPTKTRNFVDTVQNKANTAEQLVQAVKSKDVDTATALLRDLTDGKHGEVINLIEKAGNTANTISSLKTAIDNNDFSAAASFANTLSNGVTGKGISQEQITTVQSLVSAVENKDVAQSAALLNDLTGGKHGNVVGFIKTADSAVNTAEALKTAIENKDFSTAIDLANTLSQDVSGRALPEQLTTAKSLINAVQSGDVASSTALLRELTNGKHSNIIDVFDSVGTAANQINDLKSAIENKDYSTAAGIANDLSNQVIDGDNKLSDTLETLSDVLTGKVQIRMDSLPGGIPGMKPGIISGSVGGTPGIFNGPVVQPLMANGFGAGGGQAALAQVLQPEVVEIPASAVLELTPVEQAAVERIEKSLSQGITDWDVGRGDLQDINKTIGELTAEQKTNVIESLSDDQLQTWGNEIDGFRGGLSDAEQLTLFEDLANDLDKIQLQRVYDAFGLELIRKLDEKAVQGVDAPAGFTEEEKELYLDLAQMSLDVVGIFDPTPVSDGLNTATSIVRGKWLDAGLSAVSIVPYVGDLAKAGKLGSWAKTVENVIDVAAKNPDFAKAVDPVLNKIHDAIDNIPDVLPSSAHETLGAVRSKIASRGVHGARSADGRFTVDNLRVRPNLTRPSLRADTTKAIEANAPKNGKGQFIDSKTGKVIEKPTYGHIYGHENRRILAAADKLGISQGQLNDYVNARPGFFKIEEKSVNLGHADEMPGIDNIDRILTDMKEYLGI